MHLALDLANIINQKREFARWQSRIRTRASAHTINTHWHRERFEKKFLTFVRVHFARRIVNSVNVDRQPIVCFAAHLTPAAVDRCEWRYNIVLLYYIMKKSSLSVSFWVTVIDKRTCMILGFLPASKDSMKNDREARVSEILRFFFARAVSLLSRVCLFNRFSINHLISKYDLIILI